MTFDDDLSIDLKYTEDTTLVAPSVVNTPIRECLWQAGNEDKC